MATTDLSEWLGAQLESRNMSPAGLARKAGIDKGIISRILNRERRPSPESLEAIAHALKLPSEAVFRAAGLLPPKAKADPLTEEGVYILQQLEGEDKEDALRYLRMRLQVAEERGKYSVRKRKS